MKVQIKQRYVYHKIATIEIDIDKDKYEKYLFENLHYHSLDDYLFENEDLWVEQLEDATDRAEVEFGFGCDGIFNEDDSEVELRYDCEELKLGGHL